MRINKYIASCGICSRRKAEEYIVQGKVKINDEVVKDLSTLVDVESDNVYLNNKLIKQENKKVYIMLNKPKGYVTTNSEQFGRKSTLDLIHEKERVFPIGRLDMYTEGLLLLTNDGQFANKLTHPKHEIEKRYIVNVDKKVTSEMIRKLQNGVDIGGYITKPAKVKIDNDTKFEIVISEGKNRQVRKMCEAVSLRVINLKRVQIGNISLGNLQIGKYRYLNRDEVDSI